MIGAREVVASVLLVAVVGVYAESTCPHADKIKPVNVDFTEIARKRLKLLYSTENDFSLNLDHAYIDITPTGNDTYRAVSTTTTKNNVTKTKTYTITYTDGIMHHSTLDAQGEETARTYILAHAPKENAILYYRCKSGGRCRAVAVCYFGHVSSFLSVTSFAQRMSPARATTKRFNVDLRFISLPDGNTLSEESLNQLLAVDRSLNFNGKLFRFPNQL